MVSCCCMAGSARWWNDTDWCDLETIGQLLVWFRDDRPITMTRFNRKRKKRLKGSKRFESIFYGRKLTKRFGKTSILFFQVNTLNHMTHFQKAYKKKKNTKLVRSCSSTLVARDTFIFCSVHTFTLTWFTPHLMTWTLLRFIRVHIIYLWSYIRPKVIHREHVLLIVRN